MLVDMGSDQTSLHNPYNGGYYPAGMSFDEANQLMTDDPGKFKEAVQERKGDRSVYKVQSLTRSRL